MTTPLVFVFCVLSQSVTEAYDATDEALREVERIDPEVAGMIRTARDLLFAARVKLDGAE